MISLRFGTGKKNSWLQKKVWVFFSSTSRFIASKYLQPKLHFSWFRTLWDPNFQIPQKDKKKTVIQNVASLDFWG